MHRVRSARSSRSLRVWVATASLVAGSALAVACSDDAEPAGVPVPVDTGESSTSAPSIPGDDDDDGYTEQAGDCDDDDPLVHPEAPDGCDGVDTDCNGPVDDGGFAASVAGVVDALTIQAALDASAEGDTILVCPGTWAENLAVRGPRTLRSVGGSARTVVDGGGAGSVIRALEGGVTIEGFTLTGGLSERGGGVDAGGAAGITLADVVLTGNDATLGAGAWLGADAHLERCTLDGNTASDQGGGLGVARGGQATLVDVTVRANHAPFGGGLFLYEEALVEGTRLAILENTAENGAGAYLWSAGLTGAEVLDNVATEWGGGVQLFEGGSLGGVAIRGNRAEAGGGAVARGEVALDEVVIEGNDAAIQGGGLLVEDGTTRATGTLVSGNRSAEFGGGVFLRDGVLEGASIDHNEAVTGGGLYVSSSSLSAEVREVVLSENQALETGGGLAATSATVLDGVEVTANHSDVRAGGVYLAEGVHAVRRCRIADNAALEFGGGLYVHAGGGTTVEVPEIEDNVAPVGGGIYVNGGASLTLDGGSVASNGDPQTASGGGARLAEGRLVSMASAWPDNLPQALSLADGQLLDFGVDPVSFTFACDAEGTCVGGP